MNLESEQSTGDWNRREVSHFEMLKRACQYALDCITGKERDYGGVLPTVLRAALIGKRFITELDGDQWCAHFDDFVNLQESPAGFGNEPEEATRNLMIEAEKHERRK